MMNNLGYLVGAYALIWIVLAYYFYLTGYPILLHQFHIFYR